MSKRKSRTSADWFYPHWYWTLECLQEHRRLKAPGAKRKLRLLNVAACQSVWRLFTIADCRRAIEVGERAAEGKASRAEADQFLGRANAQLRSTHSPAQRRNQWNAAAFTASLRAGVEAVIIVMGAVADMRCREWGVVDLTRFNKLREEADRDLAEIFREIFPNPFQPIAIDPRWLTSNVVDLSSAIYAERAFHLMPILADALMDAGCDSEEVIHHCRGDGPHVRGCWVVDLLTGRS